jgi:hypothetical protein
MVYNPRPPAPTAVRAWLDAAVLLKAKGPLSGLMLHVEEPNCFDPQEEAVVVAVDRFLRQHGTHPVATVSNTIFPAALARDDGIKGLRERYLAGYCRRMCRQGEWGRYFHRMVAWPGRPNGTIDQIGEMITMLRKSVTPGERFYENIYEIALCRYQGGCPWAGGRRVAFRQGLNGVGGGCSRAARGAWLRFGRLSCRRPAGRPIRASWSG